VVENPIVTFTMMLHFKDLFESNSKKTGLDSGIQGQCGSPLRGSILRMI
jgi:hypothetical protein